MNKIFFSVAMMLLGTSAVFADETKPERSDCPRAQMLPKEASDDNRRIVCNIPEDLQEQVTLSQFFGGQLRIHDLAAWMTTDSLKEAGAFKKKNVPGRMVGWLTFEEKNLVRVGYYAVKDGVTYRFSEADLDLKSLKAGNNRLLNETAVATQEELGRLGALNTAKSQQLLNCTGPFNSIVLPFTSGNTEETRVYLFSPWTDKIAPLGGHHLIRVDKDGKNVLSQYSQTRSCINNDNAALRNKELAMIMVTHLTSDAPTEMHVFLSMQYKKPIYVMTISNGITWIIDGYKISVVDRRDGKKPHEVSSKNIEGE